MISRFAVKYISIAVTGCLLSISTLGAQSPHLFVTPSKDYHIVQPGESIDGISAQYNIDASTLREYNHIENARLIVGQKIYLTAPKSEHRSYYVTQVSIPRSGFHVVEEGQDLEWISLRYGVDAIDLLEFNDFADLSLKPGQKVWLEDGHLEVIPELPPAPLVAMPASSEIRTEPLCPKVSPEVFALPEIDTVGFVTSLLPPETPQTIPSSTIYHIVKKGESLSKIGMIYNVPQTEIKQINGLRSNRLSVGQRLLIHKGTEASVASVSTPATAPVYHKVKRGESLSKIGLKYKVSPDEIMSLNGLKSNRLSVGQRLLIRQGVESVTTVASAPVPSGLMTTASMTPAAAVSTDAQMVPPVYHVVQKGETLSKIADHYQTAANTIKRLNGLRSSKLRPGQNLLIRNGYKAEPQIAVTAPSGLIMPVNGKAVSEFGWRGKRPHKGIDLAAPKGEPIYAALDGKIVFVGRQRGYGNVIIIEHTDSIMTVYAHNDTNLVRKDDLVTAGQPIATVGQTGNAKCPHLHFEYRVKGKAINPRQILPLPPLAR
jgi:murein DD-endopeptidase MepM/ murein hydrolase activator NlpD